LDQPKDLPPRILIIKLSALGNVILSLGPFAAIRAHHPGAEITVLTTPPYAGWLASAPWFDKVLSNGRPAWWDLSGLLRLRRALRSGGFDRVYDLQTSGRSSRYFRFFPRAAQPEWCGIAPGCSHPHRMPAGARMHDIDRQYAQLAVAGITERAPVDLSWSKADLARFGLPARIALLVPGSSAHRPGKRWPASRYGELACWLVARGVMPVVVGTGSETPLATTIRAAAPDTVDLTGRTTLPELTELTRAAVVAVGNDTGPMHLAAAAGCPSVVLFSGDSDPALCAPRGRWVKTLRRPDLATLPLAAVAEALELDARA
jgi:ADP-heptose:LPS heptosyltransferase